MKNIITISLLILNSFLQSQTLTATDINPQPGDVFKISMAYQSNPGAADGIGVHWNYPVMPGMQGAFTDSIFSASSVPSASLYPSATLVRKWGNNYTYLKTNSASLDGFYTAGTFPILIYPLNYGNTLSSQYSVSAVSGTKTINIKTAYSYTVTGTGTLTTPAGTFFNVLKIRGNEIQDYYENNVLVSSLTTKTSKWYMAGYHDPLLISVEKFSSDPTVDYFPYNLVSLNVPDFTGIDENQVAVSATIYPNPASEKLFIDVKDNSLTEFSIINLQGMVVKRYLSDSKKLEINVGSLPAGIYHLQIKNEFACSTKKLVVAR